MSFHLSKLTGLHKYVRTGLAIAAAGSLPVLHQAGYQPGAETTVGLDGGTTRDLIALGLALSATFYPQVMTVWKSLTNDPRVKQLEDRVSRLEDRLKLSPPESPSANTAGKS